MIHATRFRHAYLPGLFGALLLAGPGASAAQVPATQEGSRPKEAVAALEPREFLLPIKGLTEENAALLQEDLKALTTQTFRCAPCKFEQAKEGTCAKCKAALKPETRALFTSIQPAPDEGRIALRIDPRVSVPLSRLESVLAKRTLRIDEEALLLPGSVQLVVRTPQVLDPGAVQAALEEAKLFETVRAEADAATNQVLVLARAGKQAPTRAKVAAALKGTMAQLADVILVPEVPRS